MPLARRDQGLRKESGEADEREVCRERFLAPCARSLEDFKQRTDIIGFGFQTQCENYRCKRSRWLQNCLVREGKYDPEV